MTGQPSAVDVLRAHRDETYTGDVCSCGWVREPRPGAATPGSGQWRQHLADMLAAAGLLVDSQARKAADEVIAAEEERIESFVDFERHRDSCVGEINGMRRALRLLADAGLILTPERLAQERAAALEEAADEVDLDPAITGGLSEHHNAEAAAETWLRARAEAERTGGGA